MRQEKIELVQSVRNARMKGQTYKAIASQYGISESSARKYTLRNVLSEPIFYPIRKARRDRVRKVVTYLKNDYCMTFNSTLRFINSLGVKISENSLARIFYGR